MTSADTLWLSNPTLAYADWQRREAAGADRRPFAARSIVQHQAMFEHFRRHLLATRTNLATFGPDHIDTFWQSPDALGYSTATRMRYLKLLDRLCRHLVAVGVRESNPANQLVRNGHWPKDEPDPIYLPEDADARLQAWVQPHDGDDLAALRSRAIVAFFLATGITAAEARTATREDLQPGTSTPYLRVPAHGARDTRTVPIGSFAVPILAEWRVRRQTLPIAGDLVFSLRPSGEPITDMSFGKIVRAALLAIDFEDEDMSPRVLRNTYCRRQLLAGHGRDEVSKLLGLASTRTCDRIRATIAMQL
ncbi:site-specific integrase [Cupriavidus sp. CV2]|uniref:tyrosine-type recombinase/integrase n=1 Tax=Cupriavidus ulmosensis TaxID=3065913 RepID=UPI00296B2844|nr:site-specific integrase [Cupriavidus sp. CV2]MDW3686161.1 site-specific integrase [Cupriavidus sp. CV2]